MPEDRTAEIAAVEDTIAILNTDASFDNFERTVNVAFLQTSALTSASERERLGRAAAALERGAALTGAPALSLLATKARTCAGVAVLGRRRRWIPGRGGPAFFSALTLAKSFGFVAISGAGSS